MSESRNIFLFVIWAKARKFEREIHERLAGDFDILFETEVKWPWWGFPRKLAEFYQFGSWFTWWNKARKCGRGAFQVIVVEDRRPVWERRHDTRGQDLQMDGRVYRDKADMRKLTGHSNIVHSSVTLEETDQQLRVLFGCGLNEVLAMDRTSVPPEGVTAESSVEPFACGVPRLGLKPDVHNAHVFLEHKYINDRFLEGIWKGRDCIVKASTKAVWSIGNEYRMNAAMYAAAPDVVPMPFAWHRALDGRSAFVVTEKVAGPSLTELLVRGITPAEADGFAADIRALAAALKRTGILHRDLFADNLLLCADGHLKAIDWQLAIDRNDYREDPWVERNWKFRYVVFGVNRELGLGVWNDFHALGKILARFPQTERVKAVATELAAAEPEMTYASPPQGADRRRLRLYGWSLRLQMLLRGRKHRKYAQLERRWRTVTCRWPSASESTGEGEFDFPPDAFSEANRIGEGRRRVCYRLPGTQLCLKSYRYGEELLNCRKKLSCTILGEIERQRFSYRGNTSVQEVHYMLQAREKLPPEFKGVFPEVVRAVCHPQRGWCALQSVVENADGTPPKRFTKAYRLVDASVQKRLVDAYWKLITAFADSGVRFYDPQNVLVQWNSDGGFRLRVVDLEPCSRSLIPIDRIGLLSRWKVIRRAKRFLKDHLGVE